MRLKTWLVIAAVAVCLGLFVFGRETCSYLAGTREYTKNAVKETMPPQFEVSRLKTMLSKLDCVIEKRRGGLVDMQLQAEALEKEIGNRRGDLVADRVALEKAAALLEDKQETYTIGGVKYAYAEVDADARVKAERFRQDMDMLAARENTLVQFVQAINDTRGVLSNAEVERQRLGNEIERLEIRAASLKTNSQVATERQAGKDTSLGTAYENIQKAVTELEHRLAKGERMIEFKRTGSTGINYAKNDVQQSGLEAIREVLQ